MPPATPLAGVSILLVEDDADSLDLLSLVFLHAAATVTSASNATDGYALYKSSPPAIVVTDIAMPERDGFWLLDAIRSVPSIRPAPVVAITALAMPNERERILTAGFAAYVVKPIDPDEVVSVVRRCLDQG